MRKAVLFLVSVLFVATLVFPSTTAAAVGSNIYCVGNNWSAGGTNVDGDYLYTAIGCVPYRNTSDFLAFVLNWALGIGGGVAFLLIVYSGIIILTSTGNPDKVRAGQELLTAAITGLLLLIFSAFILRLIGVDILQIPGFGTN